jgi:hypothetical protein
MKSDKPELLSLLVAYPYMTAEMVRLLNENQTEIRFLLDSGAFTAWKSGRSINVDDYCRFIDSLPFKPWRYFTLDVIGDPHGSLKNYETMLKRGFNPVPIFTRGEDVSVLDDYYKTSDVVGIGGLVGTRGNKGFVNGIMKKVGERKVHWLGFTSHDYVKSYRPYMCDSSTWESGARYGTAKLYCGRGKFIKFCRQSFANGCSPAMRKALLLYGITLNDINSKIAFNGGTSLVRWIGAQSIVKYSSDIRRQLKTLVFSAAATSLAVSLLLEGIRNENRPNPVGWHGFINAAV